MSSRYLWSPAIGFWLFPLNQVRLFLWLGLMKCIFTFQVVHRPQHQESFIWTDCNLLCTENKYIDRRKFLLARAARKICIFINLHIRRMVREHENHVSPGRLCQVWQQMFRLEINRLQWVRHLIFSCRSLPPFLLHLILLYWTKRLLAERIDFTLVK